MRHDMLSPFQDAMTKEARETRLHLLCGRRRLESGSVLGKGNGSQTVLRGVSKPARLVQMRGCTPRSLWCAPFCVRSPASTARITASWRQQRPLLSILYLFLQKSMIKGLTACAIKG